MRVLLACERSGIVRDAFRRRGHDAWSCDLSPSQDPKFHYQCDVLLPLCRNSWDLVIAFPPCTYLAVSGARWWKEKQAEQDEAIRFFSLFTKMTMRWAIENPIGIMSRLYRKADQIVQPWMFGHGETKATCLWLNGLPKLQPTNIVEGRQPRVHHESPGVKNGLTRQQRRSETLPGIAEAMAEQWG